MLCCSGERYRAIMALLFETRPKSNSKVLIFFLFLHENICCGYSLDGPRGGTSNEHPQHVFMGKYEKYYLDTPLIDLEQ